MGFLGDIFNRKPKPGRPVPVTDIDFQSEVLESELPVIVDFWSKTCAPCHVMGGLLDEIGPEYIGRLKFYKLNVENSMVTAAKFQVSGVPTLLLIYKGKVVDRITGLLPMIPLRERLDNIVSYAAKNK